MNTPAKRKPYERDTLPDCCKPRRHRPKVKSRRCPDCLAPYTGDTCKAPFHHITRPAFSIYTMRRSA